MGSSKMSPTKIIFTIFVSSIFFINSGSASGCADVDDLSEKVKCLEGLFESFERSTNAEIQSLHDADEALGKELHNAIQSGSSKTGEDPIPALIVFSAYAAPANDLYLDNTYVNFDSFWVASEHFNLERGEFTAPVTGTYQFNFMSHGRGGNGVEVEVRKNGGKLLHFRSVDMDYTSLMSPSWTVNLGVGDQIRLYISYAYLRRNNNLYTAFSGVLL